MSVLDPTEPDLFDVITAPAAVGTGEDRAAVELAAADAAALGALAERVGLPPAAIWRAAWALVLARLAGVERVRVGGCVIGADELERGGCVIDVPAAGELAPWLAGAAAARPEAAGGAASQSAWADPEPAPAPALTGDGPALIWQARGAGAAVARFDAARLDRATVERLGELLRVAIAGLVAPGARLETVSPLSAERAHARRRDVEPHGERVPHRGHGPRAVPRAGRGAARSASRSCGTAGG